MEKKGQTRGFALIFFEFNGPHAGRSVSFDIFTDFCQVLLDTVRIFIPDILQED